MPNLPPIVSLSLLVALLLAQAAGAEARQATPVVILASLDPEACDVEPRTEEELRALLDVGLAAEETATAAPAASPIPPEKVPGELVDAETLAAVTAAAAAFQACSNAGDLPRLLALMTDELAAAYLADLAPFLAGEERTTSTPIGLDPADRDRVVADLPGSRPRPPRQRAALVELRDARVVASGCVRATVVWISGITAPETYDGVVDFCLVGGRYRWHVGPPPAGVEGGTGARPAVEG